MPDPSRAPWSRRALLAGLAGAAAGPSRGSARAAPRIGVILPGYGPAERLAREAAEAAATLLAARDRPLTLSFSVARGGAAEVGRAAQRLIDEGSVLLVSACGDSATEAALAVTERRQTPLIVAAATEPALGDRGSRLIVRTGPTTSQLIGRGLGLLRDLYGQAALPLPQRLCLVHADTAEGRQVRDGLAAILPTSGLPVTGQAEIALAAGPAAAAAERAAATLREARPDLLFVAAPPEAAARLVSAITSAPGGAGLSGMASFGLPGLAAPEVIDLPGEAGAWRVTFAPWADPRSAVTAEIRRMLSRPDLPWRFETVQGEIGLVVDPVLLAGEALARHPNARGAALAASLRGSVLTQKMMAGPPMRFDSRGQNTALPSVALQNQGGAPRVVLPEGQAEAAPVWPNPTLYNG